MTVSRAAVTAILLAAVAVLLAIGLFVAGAMWRARVTGRAGPRAETAAARLASRAASRVCDTLTCGGFASSVDALGRR